MVEAFVLDTSALMAYLEAEPGGEEVQRVLNMADSGRAAVFTSFATWTELRYIAIQEQGEGVACQIMSEMARLPIEVVHSDRDDCDRASTLKALCRLSLADAFVAALTQQKTARLVHKDPEFDNVPGQLEVLRLPYK